MELLLLLLVLPLAWLLLLPRRVAGVARRFSVPGFGILIGAVVLGFIMLRAAPPAPETITDYAAGDTALRVLLE